MKSFWILDRGGEGKEGAAYEGDDMLPHLSTTLCANVVHLQIWVKINTIAGLVTILGSKQPNDQQGVQFLQLAPKYLLLSNITHQWSVNVVKCLGLISCSKLQVYTIHLWGHQCSAKVILLEEGVRWGDRATNYFESCCSRSIIIKNPAYGRQ